MWERSFQQGIRISFRSSISRIGLLFRLLGVLGFISNSDSSLNSFKKEFISLHPAGFTNEIMNIFSFLSRNLSAKFDTYSSDNLRTSKVWINFSI